ncbi:MAG: FAD-dependent oxidoreductase, partial [Firmicutes bacterium]|nr:FAD-dependent oxidoreductase [Bacillota bacterium]
MPDQDRVLVIGGGPAGLEAARGVAEMGRGVLLVEARERLGGTPLEHYATLTPDLGDAREAMEAMARAVAAHPRVDVRLGTRVVAAAGEAGAFRVTLEAADGSRREEEAGAVVIATGFQH